MEITPEIRRAWERYWRESFSRESYLAFAHACRTKENFMSVAAALTGSTDFVASSQTYQGERTRVPLGFQFK